jgi:hypothetical protein
MSNGDHGDQSAAQVATQLDGWASAEFYRRDIPDKRIITSTNAATKGSRFETIARWLKSNCFVEACHLWTAAATAEMVVSGWNIRVTLTPGRRLCAKKGLWLKGSVAPVPSWEQSPNVSVRPLARVPQSDPVRAACARKPTLLDGVGTNETDPPRPSVRRLNSSNSLIEPAAPT